MTLITAWPYDSGVIISADSQETAKDANGDEFKYSVLKLEPERMGKFDILIAGGGNGDAIDAFIETVRQFLAKPSRIATLPELKEAIQKQLTKFRRTLNSQGDDATMNLFIAAHVGKGYEVWKTKSSVLTPASKPDMIGFTAELYRHAGNQLYWDNMPAIQATLASLKVLEFAKQTCTCVDRPFSVAIVQDSGIWRMPDTLVRHYIDSVSLFSTYLDRLLLACADTQLKTEQFEKYLTEFSETFRRLRSDYLQAVGTAVFRNAIAPGFMGDPISYIPFGTTVSFMGDGSVVVKEDTPEDIEQRRRYLEAAQAGVNAWATEKFAKIMGDRRDRRLIYLDQEVELTIAGSQPSGQ